MEGNEPAGGTWTRVASLRELRRSGRLRANPGGLDILILLAGEEIIACGNICAHQHVPRLHEGAIDGHRVTCPMHGWTFDVRTGRCTTGEGSIPVFRARTRGDDIEIDAG